jgi:hypothetical protein
MIANECDLAGGHFECGHAVGKWGSEIAIRHESAGAADHVVVEAGRESEKELTAVRRGDRCERTVCRFSDRAEEADEAGVPGKA